MSSTIIQIPTKDGKGLEVIAEVESREGQVIQPNFWAKHGETEGEDGKLVPVWQALGGRRKKAVPTLISHSDVVMPILEEGWQIERQSVYRKGLGYTAFLTAPSDALVADPITWDHSYWNYKGEDEGLLDSVKVSVDIAKGRVKLLRGFWRQVCTNGLMSQVANFGSISFHTSDFENGYPHEELFTGEKPFFGALERNVLEDVMGPWVGRTSGASRLQSIMSSDAPELTGLPPVVSDLMRPLFRMPTWWKASFAEQLSLMSGKQEPKLYALDLLNALTSPVSVEDARAESRSLMRPLARTDSVYKASALFIGFSSS